MFRVHRVGAGEQWIGVHHLCRWGGHHQPTMDPEPSQPPPTLCIKPLPEPTAYTELEPATMLISETTPEPVIAQEAKPKRKSGRCVSWLATSSVPVGVLVEFEVMEWGHTHIPAAQARAQVGLNLWAHALFSLTLRSSHLFGAGVFFLFFFFFLPVNQCYWSPFTFVCLF